MVWYMVWLDIMEHNTHTHNTQVKHTTNDKRQPKRTLVATILDGRH